MTEKDFENLWIEKLKGTKKLFPSHFIEIEQSKTLIINEKILTLGSEFFGSYEIIDTDGEVVATVSEYEIAKFYFYSSLSRPKDIKIPTDELLIKSSVKEYEKHLDSILREVNKDFKKSFPDSKNFNAVSNQIFNLSNLRRY